MKFTVSDLRPMVKAICSLSADDGVTTLKERHKALADGVSGYRAHKLVETDAK